MKKRKPAGFLFFWALLMLKIEKKLPYEILPALSQNFFKLSAELGDIASFRRILSIMQLKPECKTLIRVKTIIDILGGETCQNKKDNRRCDSCQSYLKQMENQKGSLRLTQKICTKLYFFSCEINENGVSGDTHQGDFLGYCTIHQDTFIENNSNQNQTYIRSYVPECVLKIGEQNKSFLGYKYGSIASNISLGDESFSIDKGNYFSQQNGMTNCCAHAAIKTALRGYDPTISCDSLNKVLIKSKRDQGCTIDDETLEIGRMARGLTPEEMLTAIKNFSLNSPNMPALAPYLIKAHDLPITSFVETIYRAIESKIPVILLLRIPDNVAMGNSFVGHAVSLVGHTFNKHNWCAYGSGYFSAENQVSYLSSYLWCDNYVVQDDNFGPAYQLPCNFLSDYYEYGVTIEKLGLNIASQKVLDNMGLNYPLDVIIIPPAKLETITEKLDTVERAAAQYFVQQLGRFSRDKVLNLSEKQRELFDRYFYYIFKYKRTKPRVFITRTLLTSKKEYLESSVKDIYAAHQIDDKKLTDVLNDDILPDFFWLTEVSVPELYQISYRKIGEIITEVITQESTEIRLIRIPFFLALYPPGETEYFPIELNNQSTEKEPHHKILRKSQGIIRQCRR